LEQSNIEGAMGVIVNIKGGCDIGMREVQQAVSTVQKSAHPDANIIFGAVVDDEERPELQVTVIAAGFANAAAEGQRNPGSSLGAFESAGPAEIAGLPEEEPSADALEGTPPNAVVAFEPPEAPPEESEELMAVIPDVEPHRDAQDPAPCAPGVLQETESSAPEAESVEDGAHEDEPEVQYLFPEQNDDSAPEDPVDVDWSSNEDSEDLDIPAFMRKRKRR
jgi:cell division protein FtsZ